MDPFEFPGRGEKPKTGVSAGTAAKMCKDAGRRLCSGAEWRKACGATRFVYGDDFDEQKCNVSGKVQEAGAFPSCKSAAGVFDLVGNASEWAADGMLHGGDAGGGKGATCVTAAKRFMPGPTNGFRCCADATR
jgi:formylglycine-generating enzyme required for sulfatase activity